jgi:integrase
VSAKTLTQLLPSYLEDRKVLMHCSDNTLKMDRAAINLLVRHAGDIQPRNITRQHIRSLTAALDKMENSTFNGRVSQLRTFFKWCRDERIVPKDFDPTEGLRHRPDPGKPRNRVPATKFPALLDSAPHPTHRAFLALGLYTLLRGTDITSRRVKDLDLDSGRLAVYESKKKRYRYVPITQDLDVEMRRWLRYYAEQCGTLEPDWYLLPNTHDAACPRDPVTNRFLTRRGVHAPKLNPLLPLKNVERVVQGALAAVGQPVHREGGHTLRRSGARAYYDVLVQDPTSGARALRRVMVLLGHSSVQMTERYMGLGADEVDLEEAIKGRSMFAVPETVVTLRRVEEA